MDDYTKQAVSQSVDSVTELPTPDKSTEGSGHVRPMQGTGAQLRSRFLKLDNAGGIKSCYWPAGSKLGELTFSAVPIAGSPALLGDEEALIAVDPVNLAAATNMLTQTESVSGDVQWIPIQIGQPFSLPLRGTANAAGDIIQNGTLGGGIIYAKTVGGVAIDLWIGAN